MANNGTKTSKIHKITKEEYEYLVKNSKNMKGLMEKIGIKGGATLIKVKKILIDLKVDTSHFPTSILHSDTNAVFVKNTKYSDKSIRRLIYHKNLLPKKCSICNINQWNNKPIILQIDHIDGNGTNNELSNLRLLCPNCHSQTETYCWRNIKGKIIKENKCKNCMVSIRTYNKSGYCMVCYNKYVNIAQEYRCKDCNNNITKTVVKYGKGRCKDCNIKNRLENYYTENIVDLEENEHGIKPYITKRGQNRTISRINKDQLQRFVDKSINFKDLLEKLGYDERKSKSQSNIEAIKYKMDQLKINYNHLKQRKLRKKHIKPELANQY